MKLFSPKTILLALIFLCITLAGGDNGFHHHLEGKAFHSKAFFEPHHENKFRNLQVLENHESNQELLQERSRGLSKQFRADGILGGILDFVSGFFSTIFNLILGALNSIFGIVNVKLIASAKDQTCSCAANNGSTSQLSCPGGQTPGEPFNPFAMALDLIQKLLVSVINGVINIINFPLGFLGINIPKFQQSEAEKKEEEEAAQFNILNPLSVITSLLGKVFNSIANVGISIINTVFGRLFDFEIPPLDGTTKPGQASGVNNAIAILLKIISTIFGSIINGVIGVINLTLGNIFGFKIEPYDNPKSGEASNDPFMMIKSTFVPLFSSILDIITNIFNGVFGFLNIKLTKTLGEIEIGPETTTTAMGKAKAECGDNPIQAVISTITNLVRPLLNPIIGVLNKVLGVFDINLPTIGPGVTGEVTEATTSQAQDVTDQGFTSAWSAGSYIDRSKKKFAIGKNHVKGSKNHIKNNQKDEKHYFTKDNRSHKKHTKIHMKDNSYQKKITKNHGKNDENHKKHSKNHVKEIKKHNKNHKKHSENHRKHSKNHVKEFKKHNKNRNKHGKNQAKENKKRDRNLVKNNNEALKA